MIAITGGAASGKSTVLKAVGDRGYRTLSADAIVAELWRDEAFLAGVADEFDLDQPTKAAVRDIILALPHRRRALNELTHTAVVSAIFAEHPDFVEIPLLVEAGLVGRFREVWVCSCDRATQLNRLQARGLSPEQSEAILSIQVTDSVRCSFADEIFRTNGDISHVLSQIDLALGRSQIQDQGE